MLCAPGSVSPHTRFVAQVHLLSTQEGGRTTGLASHYRPRLFFRTTDVVGDVELRDTAIPLPGDSVEMVVALGKPVAMDVGLGFAIREGNRTWAPARCASCSTEDTAGRATSWVARPSRRGPGRRTR